MWQHSVVAAAQQRRQQRRHTLVSRLCAREATKNQCVSVHNLHAARARTCKCNTIVYRNHSNTQTYLYYYMCGTYVCTPKQATLLHSRVAACKIPRCVCLRACLVHYYVWHVFSVKHTHSHIEFVHAPVFQTLHTILYMLVMLGNSRAHVLRRRPFGSVPSKHIYFIQFHNKAPTCTLHTHKRARTHRDDGVDGDGGGGNATHHHIIAPPCGALSHTCKCIIIAVVFGGHAHRICMVYAPGHCAPHS